MLKFTFGNSKLSSEIAILSLPAGWTCPGAEKCLCRSNRLTGKVTDGPKQEFRCYAASEEALFPNARKLRWNNLNQLKGKTREQIIDLINFSLPVHRLIRIHSSGDFFSQDYFDAWLEVARQNPKKLFYAYTKSLVFWQNRIGQIPKNFKLNASFGGKFDNLIEKLKLKYVKVVFSLEEANQNKLKIDHDDKLAYSSGKSFALLLHGMQKAKTLSSKSLFNLRKLGWYGYGSKFKSLTNIKNFTNITT